MTSEKQPLQFFADYVHHKIVYPWLTRGEAQNDREIAHERALDLMEMVQGNPFLMGILSKAFVYQDPILETEFCGITAPNPIGIAAGFDKNARVFPFLGQVAGFGFVTVGSITKLRYAGNDRPRIFTLPVNDSLINRMGFPGEGSDEAELRLSYFYHQLKLEQRTKHFALFINQAASAPSFQRGLAVPHYLEVYQQLLPYGDADEINISSPNTVGVTGVQEPEVFIDLASGIQHIRRQSSRPEKPFGGKFSPDLPMAKLEQDVKISIDNGADFITLTNTTTDQATIDPLIDESNKGERGGYSGACLTQRSLEISHRIWEYTEGALPIKRAGGLMNAEDLWDALTYGGATIGDFYAAFVSERRSGPNFTYNILKNFAEAIRLEGMTSMKDFKELRGKSTPFPKI